MTNSIPPEDWRLRYASFSSDELQYAAWNLDREQFPERATILDAEIEKRRTLGPVQRASADTMNAALSSFFRWRRVLLGAWLGLIPAELLIGTPLDHAVGSEVPSRIVGFLAMTLFLIGGIMVSRFRCPKCGERFASRRNAVVRVFNPFLSRCQNCGLTR
jgi:predicted RNA-binding Zn-ribbon protein involved in translation (DUF1610 family)